LVLRCRRPIVRRQAFGSVEPYYCRPSAYVVSARECAQSLQLSRVQFIAHDARDADLSRGTVFYLYSPFKGSILADVLGALRRESMHRSIKICSLGPCTHRVSDETWLKTSEFSDTGSITVFNSL
jgi:hypothetical protein